MFKILESKIFSKSSEPERREFFDHSDVMSEVSNLRGVKNAVELHEVFSRIFKLGDGMRCVDNDRKDFYRISKYTGPVCHELFFGNSDFDKGSITESQLYSREEFIDFFDIGSILEYKTHKYNTAHDVRYLRKLADKFEEKRGYCYLSDQYSDFLILGLIGSAFNYAIFEQIKTLGYHRNNDGTLDIPKEDAKALYSELKRIPLHFKNSDMSLLFKYIKNTHNRFGQNEVSKFLSLCGSYIEKQHVTLDEKTKSLWYLMLEYLISTNVNFPFDKKKMNTTPPSYLELCEMGFPILANLTHMTTAYTRIVGMSYGTFK